MVRRQFARFYLAGWAPCYRVRPFKDRIVIVRRSGWRHVTKRGGGDLEGEGRGDCRRGYDARTEEGTGTAGDLKETMASIQAAALGVGGLIHVAAGLAGETGGLLTKRAGFSQKA